MKNRRGFTLVELIVVALVGAVLMGATYQVLITNQRTYTVQNEETRARQIVRSGSDVLFTELREVSAAGGDILEIDDTSLRIKVMRSYGLACDVSSITASPPTVDVLNRGQQFAVGDSVVIFADNEEGAAGDDAWIRARVTAVSGGLTCAGDPNLGAQRLTFTGQRSLFEADSVRDGAPLRSFTETTYGLVSYGDRWFVGREDAGSVSGAGSATPLVGPVKGPDEGRPGLTFRYLDADGNATTTLADIVQVEVTLRSDSEATYSDGGMVNDTLVTRIYLRN
jgi:prepilin-type N-terminal cleavage/methylation domain-containing protein